MFVRMGNRYTINPPNLNVPAWLIPSVMKGRGAEDRVPLVSFQYSIIDRFVRSSYGQLENTVRKFRSLPLRTGVE
jgi:hypothetical protein